MLHQINHELTRGEKDRGGQRACGVDRRKRLRDERECGQLAGSQVVGAGATV